MRGQVVEDFEANEYPPRLSRFLHHVQRSFDFVRQAVRVAAKELAGRVATPRGILSPEPSDLWLQQELGSHLPETQVVAPSLSRTCRIPCRTAFWVSSSMAVGTSPFVDPPAIQNPAILFPPKAISIV